MVELEIESLYTNPNLHQLIRSWEKSGDELLSSGDLEIDLRFFEDWKFIKGADSPLQIDTCHIILLAPEFSEGPPLVIMNREQQEDFFNFPGGEPETNETLGETIRRELLEETGLSGISFDRIGTLIFPQNDEVTALYCGLVTPLTEIQPIHDSNIAQRIALPYIFFHTELVQTNTGDSRQVELALNNHLAKQEIGLSLTPTRFGT